MGFQWRLTARGMESRFVHFSKLAKQHFRRARDMGYKSVIDRYENDLVYQESCDQVGYSEETLLRFEHDGNPANRSSRVTLPWRQRYDRYANWSFDAVGMGQNNRGADPASVQHGGSNTIRWEWVHRPYNYNEDARDRYWRSARWDSWDASSSSDHWVSQEGWWVWRWKMRLLRWQAPKVVGMRCVLCLGSF